MTESVHEGENLPDDLLEKDFLDEIGELVKPSANKLKRSRYPEVRDLLDPSLIHQKEEQQRAEHDLGVK